MTADPHPFVAAVAAGLERIGAGGSLLVACSGGGDSLALLRACVELNRDVTAGYFDHRQRASSQADGSAVASFAETWGCGFVTSAFPGPRGVGEAELRNARYAWLADATASVSAGWVLTGHTADDRAETVLLRLLRGTGVAGLAGIAAAGPVPGRADAAVKVGRPMLRLAGREAREFLTVRGIRWVEDPSNAAADYTRNRLRRDLLPRLSDFNPRWEEAVLRLADGAAGGAAVTAALAEKVADRAVLFARGATDRGVGARVGRPAGRGPRRRVPGRLEAGRVAGRADVRRGLAPLGGAARRPVHRVAARCRGGARDGRDRPASLTSDTAGPAGSPTG